MLKFDYFSEFQNVIAPTTPERHYDALRTNFVMLLAR